jgi:hypothetical protein
MDFVAHKLSNCEAQHGEADGNLVQLGIVTNITNTPMHHVVAVEGEMRAEELKLNKNVCYLLNCKRTNNYDTPVIEFILFGCFLCLMFHLQKSKTISLKA